MRSCSITAPLLTSIKDASGGYYVGATDGLYYVAPGSTEISTLVAGNDVSHIAIYAGSLWVASPNIGSGVYLVGTGGALPTSGPASLTLVTQLYTRGLSSFIFESPSKIWATVDGANACAFLHALCHVSIRRYDPLVVPLQPEFTGSTRPRCATRLHATPLLHPITSLSSLAASQASRGNLNVVALHFILLRTTTARSGA